MYFKENMYNVWNSSWNTFLLLNLSREDTPETAFSGATANHWILMTTAMKKEYSMIIECSQLTG